MSDRLVIIDGTPARGSTLSVRYCDYLGTEITPESIEWLGSTSLQAQDWTTLSVSDTLYLGALTPYLIKCRVVEGAQFYESSVLAIEVPSSSDSISTRASNLNILGKGVDFRTPINSITRSAQEATDIERVNQSLYIIFTTVKGSVPMLPNLGSELASTVFSIISPDDLTSIEMSVREDIAEQEPRVAIDDLSVSFDSDNNALLIRLTYHIVNTNVSSNFIYSKTLAGGEYQ